MHSRSVVPRPDRRLVFSLSALALLPFFLGGIAAVGPENPAETPGRVSDTALLWVFLSSDVWDSPAPSKAMAGLDARIRVRSEWLEAVSLELPVGKISALESISGVLAIRPVGRLTPPVSLRASQGGHEGHGSRYLPRAPADTTYGDLGGFLDMLGVPDAHSLGFMGTGTRIGILDGFFLPDHPTVENNPPVRMRDFVDNDLDVRPGPGDPQGAGAHGTALWSLVAADLPGELTGSAPKAGILLARVWDGDELTGVEEDHWVQGLEWLESQGARVVLSGFGFRRVDGTDYSIEELNGDVTPATLAADQAAQRGVLVVAPVGNAGPEIRSLQAPSDGDSVLAVGSVDPTGVQSVFSALGPTGDGREKPDLMAPGEGLPAAALSGVEPVGPVDGTEYSGALLAGAAALFVEAYPGRGPMEVVSALEVSVQPNSISLPDVASAILFPDGIQALPVQDVGPDGRVTSLAPQFEWNTPTLHPLGLPVTFHLEFAKDSVFQNIVLRDSVVGTFARRLQEPLPARSRLFWRVEARSVQGIRAATSPQGPLLVPPWVSLDVLNEPAGSQLSDPTPEFRWTPLELPGPAGPFTFSLQVLSDREEDIVQSHGNLQATRFEIPEPLPFNVPLRWRVIAEARGEEVDTVTSGGPFVISGTDSPPVTILHQNFPNPFPNRDLGLFETRIWFDLAAPSSVELSVFDLRGRLVRRLIPGPGCTAVEMDPGLYGREEGDSGDPCVRYSWDGTDDRGEEVSPGVYLLRFSAGGVVQVKRIVFWP
jgi:serine protease AprX